MRLLLHCGSGEAGKSPEAEKSLADHLNGEYMTEICNFYPLPYPCSYPHPVAAHFSALSLCQRHSGFIRSRITPLISVPFPEIFFHST